MWEQTKYETTGGDSREVMHADNDRRENALSAEAAAQPRLDLFRIGPRQSADASRDDAVLQSEQLEPDHRGRGQARPREIRNRRVTRPMREGGGRNHRHHCRAMCGIEDAP